jgi:hypothetical protein
MRWFDFLGVHRLSCDSPEHFVKQHARKQDYDLAAQTTWDIGLSTVLQAGDAGRTRRIQQLPTRFHPA